MSVSQKILPRFTGVSGFLDGFIDSSGPVTAAASPNAFGSEASTLPSDATQRLVRLVGEDGGHSRAIHYSLGGERTAVFVMHPRADCSSHYLTPALLEAGYAVFAAQSRYFNNDEDCLHEAILADIAAGMRYLRALDFEKIVFLGNSGGGSLFSFYQAMAETPPPGRYTHTPGGTAYDLNALDLPPGDGLLLLAAHIGEGKFLMNVIDPSVTDEADPLSCDPGLDMYNPANGFRPPPRTSRYSQEFLARYRAGQRARVARLDALARQQIAENKRFAELLEPSTAAELSLDQRIALERRSVLGRYLMIARTDADPVACDLSLHPSSRVVGSIQGPRPDLQNYGLGYFAHCMTPEGWLSTWSGLSSRASLIDTIAAVTVPTFAVNYTGDNSIYPPDVEAVHDAAGASDKGVLHIEGDHYGAGAGAKANASEAVLEWILERYPTR